MARPGPWAGPGPSIRAKQIETPPARSHPHKRTRELAGGGQTSPSRTQGGRAAAYLAGGCGLVAAGVAIYDLVNVGSAVGWGIWLTAAGGRRSLWRPASSPIRSSRDGSVIPLCSQARIRCLWVSATSQPPAEAASGARCVNRSMLPAVCLESAAWNLPSW